MITYNELYELVRKERYSEQLQVLPKEIISSIGAYFQEKKTGINSANTGEETDLFSESILKNKKQLESAISLFKELMLRRKKKILALVFIAAETGVSKRDFENLLPFEKKLFERMMDAISSSDKEMSFMLEGKPEGVENKNNLVVFLENVDKLLDSNGEEIGPFKQGELANIDREIAKILISAKKAEPVENGDE